MKAVYEFEGKLYINLTNRCSNDCSFCVRRIKDGVGKDSLWLEREPTAQEVIAALNELGAQQRGEVVFCGYGEPTERLQELLDVARYLKQHEIKIRLNTNGQCDLINERECAPLFKGLIDNVSISLNQANAQKYQTICQSRFGECAFDAIKRFAKACVAQGIKTQLSVVDSIGAQDIEQCREIARQIGADFRVREMIKS